MCLFPLNCKATRSSSKGGRRLISKVDGLYFRGKDDLTPVYFGD